MRMDGNVRKEASFEEYENNKKGTLTLRIKKKSSENLIPTSHIKGGNRRQKQRINLPTEPVEMGGRPENKGINIA